MTSAAIQVAEIHCARCERTIAIALARVPGVHGVRPSAARGEVRVSFDEGRVSLDTLRERLAEVGYASVG